MISREGQLTLRRAISRPCNLNRRALLRHDLVFPSPLAWRSLVQRNDDLALDPLIVDWVNNRRPLVMRHEISHGAEKLPMSLPLPPLAGNRQISIVMNSRDVFETRPPLELIGSVMFAPRAWL